LLPLDIVEATYLIPLPQALLDTTHLIASRAIALQKRREQLQLIHSHAYKARVHTAKRFEEDHSATLVNHACKPGNLILICNTAIEKALNRKMRPHYVGLLIVIAHNHGGAYILAELHGSVFDRPIVAFCMVPYLAQRHIPLPDLTSFIDISLERLQAMKDTDVVDPDADEDTSDDEDSDSDDQTIALLHSPALHASLSSSAYATGLPSSMFLVSSPSDQSHVIATHQTCVINTSLPVCLISKVAAAQCSLSMDTE